MRGKVLLLAVLGSAAIHAQQTHNINWGLGDNSTPTSIIIDEGDTVIWTWTSAHPHTVTSTAASMETFDSGTLTGNGQTFSHTFTMEGSNPYICEIHDGMAGTITVNATMGVEENIITDFEVYPNPVTERLTIRAKDIIDRVEIFDMSGKLVLNTQGGNNTSILYMQNYQTGIYLVKVYSLDKSKTITVVKN